MVNPEKVTPKNFTVGKVIFDHYGFSIAYGHWNVEGDERDCVGMRWNGEGDNDKGYPNHGKHSVWFVLPAELSIPILIMLLQQNEATRKTILDILSKDN